MCGMFTHITADPFGRASTFAPQFVVIVPVGPRLICSVIWFRSVSACVPTTCTSSLPTNAQNGGSGTCSLGPTDMTRSVGCKSAIRTLRPKFTVTAGVGFRNLRIGAPTFIRVPHAADRPVQVEVYPDHEDFAVRTMGMPGLGALGVTFGYVVAMDSPSGRPPGTFHWASTMWHELSHVYVLNMTNFRVPRWFTEGLAVHEETAASPEWGDRLDPHVIMAIKDKKLLPVAELDRGFVRPTYPTQVVVSYYQAGRICDYIDREWGWPKLLAMIHDFAGGATTPEAIEKELGIKPEEFDKRFLAALTAETKKTVDGFDEWRKELKKVATEYKAHDYEEMSRAASGIRYSYPDYVEAGNVYQFLADGYLAKGDKKAAIAELERYAKVGGRSPDTLKQLATLLEEAGKRKEAAEVLDRLNYIQPIDEDLHRRLGDLWLGLGNTAAAIREYRAVLAKSPTDPAASHFNLAKAYRTANRPDAAKDELLLSLEAAPGFRPAQKMLLELSK